MVGWGKGKGFECMGWEKVGELFGVVGKVSDWVVWWVSVIGRGWKVGEWIGKVEVGVIVSEGD